MAEQPKKPRKIKDLKARLGRTISPGGEKGGAVPPPAIGGGPVPPPPGGAGPTPPPPGGTPSGIPAPIAGPGLPTAAGVAPPPFAQPARSEPPRSADPFAASQAAGPQEVRLVIDEKPVEASEVGKRRRWLLPLLLGIGAVGGILIGGLGGSLMKDRELYNLAIQDGKDVYESVRTASETVTKAQRFVDTAVTAARGGPGKQATIDFQALEAIRGLEKPLAAGAFARKRYSAFQPETVDALFEYYNSINILWDQFARLANRSLPEARRQALTAAAESATNVAAPTGCVPAVVDNRFVCGLVYVAATEGGDGTTLQVRSRRRAGQGFEKTVFDGTQDLTEGAEGYVILVHTERSIGVLGQQASEFAEYTRDLTQIKQLLDRTMEVQGRLERDLGEIARLEGL